MKEKHCRNATIEPHKITLLIITTGKRSFAGTKQNKKVIEKRGCRPYNRNCLLHKDVRATITKEEMEEERKEINVNCKTSSSGCHCYSY